MFRAWLKNQKTLYFLPRLRISLTAKLSFGVFFSIRSNRGPVLSVPFVWLFLSVPAVPPAYAEQEGWTPSAGGKPQNSGEFLQAASSQSSFRFIAAKAERGRMRKKKRMAKSSHDYYIVQKNDSLDAIGRRTGFGLKRLARWNHLKAPYAVKAGQRLRLFGKKPRPGAATPAIAGRHGRDRRSADAASVKKNFKLRFDWPIQGKISRTFAQANGKGIDIAGKMGAIVRAAETGVVIYSGNGLKRLGNLVIIEHNAAYLTAYANNRRLLVAEKQSVRKGQPIAELGTFWSQKPRLHFEIRKNGKPVNPLLLLPVRR